MRQRTKIGTRFGVRHQHAVGETFVEHTTFEAEVDDLTTEQEAERRARVQLARCRKQKRGCKFVRAVSYRLAPLVELPAWEHTPDNCWRVTAGEQCHAFIEVDQDPEDEENVCFEAFVYWPDDGTASDENVMLFESSTLDEVKRWVAERLRLMGFKVAKA